VYDRLDRRPVRRASDLDGDVRDDLGQAAVTLDGLVHAGPLDEPVHPVRKRVLPTRWNVGGGVGERFRRRGVGRGRPDQDDRRPRRAIGDPAEERVQRQVVEGRRRHDAVGRLVLDREPLDGVDRSLGDDDVETHLEGIDRSVPNAPRAGGADAQHRSSRVHAFVPLCGSVIQVTPRLFEGFDISDVRNDRPVPRATAGGSTGP